MEVRTMAQGFQTLTNWTIGGGQPAPPRKALFFARKL
jgi:hypothetical protein